MPHLTSYFKYHPSYLTYLTSCLLFLASCYLLFALCLLPPFISQKQLHQNPLFFQFPDYFSKKSSNGQNLGFGSAVVSNIVFDLDITESDFINNLNLILWKQSI